MRRGFSLAFVTAVALAACGGTDKEGLFGSAGASGAGAGGTAAGSSGTGGGTTGGASGVGATGGFNTTGGASGAGATGGFNTTGGSSGVGGSSGSGGDDGGVTGGSSGNGGSPGVGGSAGVGGSSGNGGSGGSGAMPGLGSCWGHCGSTQPVSTGSSPCYCDAQCSQFNDCCDDYKAACGPAGAGQVNCLTAGTCSLANSFCCNAWTGQSYALSCAPKGQDCDPGVDFYCDGPEDCGGGTVCCGHFENSGGNNGFWTDLTCKPAGQCGQWPNVVICGNNPGVCGGGAQCTQSGSQPQIRYCDP